MSDANRTLPIIIDIDAQSTRRKAGQIVIDALRECGIDPMKAARNLMMQQLVMTWGRGEMARETFLRACRNMKILNPSLALSPSDGNGKGST